MLSVDTPSKYDLEYGNYCHGVTHEFIKEKLHQNEDDVDYNDIKLN
jgi:hypothetical protein